MSSLHIISLLVDIYHYDGLPTTQKMFCRGLYRVLFLCTACPLCCPTPQFVSCAPLGCPPVASRDPMENPGNLWDAYPDKVLMLRCRHCILWGYITHKHMSIVQKMLIVVILLQKFSFYEGGSGKCTYFIIVLKGKTLLCQMYMCLGRDVQFS